MCSNPFCLGCLWLRNYSTRFEWSNCHTWSWGRLADWIFRVILWMYSELPVQDEEWLIYNHFQWTSRLKIGQSQTMFMLKLYNPLKFLNPFLLHARGYYKTVQVPFVTFGFSTVVKWFNEVILHTPRQQPFAIGVVAWRLRLDSQWPVVPVPEV